MQGRYASQVGPRRGEADWNAIREVRRVLPADVTLVGNGDVKLHADFARMQAGTGCNAVMAGYYALLDPTIFGPRSVPLQEVVETYLRLARQHPNKFIAVLRPPLLHVLVLAHRRAQAISPGC